MGLGSSPPGRWSRSWPRLELETLRLAEYGTPVAVIARRTHLAAGTVRNHLAACVQKLGAADRADAIRLAREAGWL
ncbi:MAG: LuxR C-terminal-related transcriptional regulator [Micromonospora sp.]